jgi:nitrite reductase/ring-hydroxylating ferredoxin subunit/multimeric flavodoxin WrbA
MDPAQSAEWQDLGPAKDFEQKLVTEVRLGKTTVAITFHNGEFGAISGVCNHVGGPLGQGTLDGDYVVCPWHHYKFHWRTGEGEPGFEADRVPSYEVRAEGGRLLLRTKPVTTRNKLPHDPFPLARPIRREAGPVRVVGISATVMDRQFPRVSTSELLLQTALDHAEKELGCGTRLLKLDSLKFRNCEGYYSKAAQACTWPCSITQMDPADQMDQVYEALVHWADVVLVATPIRWGAASSLYYKMAERLNCVQNQIAIRDNALIRNKVAAFLIIGGQDNIQSVAGQMLGFFSELGFHFPQFPYIAHSRGWSAEDMENNVIFVEHSQELHTGARDLAGRAVELARKLIAQGDVSGKVSRPGRKAYRMADESAS